MSGFTRITREEGIMHFLMLIKQMQSICLPIFSRFGGQVLKVEADDLFVLFPTPGLAVQAAAACIAATEAFSATRTRKNDKIILSIGMIDGPMWLIPHVDAFGETVEVGFRLGEDTADKKEILVHHSVKKRIQANRSLSPEEYGFVRTTPIDFEGVTHECYTVLVKSGDDSPTSRAVEAVFGQAPRRRSRSCLSKLCCCVCCLPRCLCRVTARVLCCGKKAARGEKKGRKGMTGGGALKRYASKTHLLMESLGGNATSFGGVKAGVAAAASRSSIISAEVNQEEPIDLITMLNERMNCESHAGMRAIDDRIVRRFQRQGISVLVIMLQLHNTGVGRSDELKVVHTVLEIKSIGQRIITAHNGNTVKAVQDRTVPVLFALMSSAVAAIETVVLLSKHCEQKYGKGFALRAGIASGEVLDFDGCNTFGDPVNTAFKLGEDLAGRWEVAVDPTAAKLLPVEMASNLPFTEREEEISGLTLKFQSLQMDAPPVQAALAKVEVIGIATTGFQGGAVGSLDWTELIGRGVHGVQTPYGKLQEKAVGSLQAHGRGWIQRARAVEQVRKSGNATMRARSLWKKSFKKVLTASHLMVRTSRTMQQLRKMSIDESIRFVMPVEQEAADE